MPYRRVEPSNPRWTPPGIHFLTFQSEALEQRGSVTVYIPPGHEQDRSLPLVLLLHGVFGNHWSWCFMGGAHVRAQGMIDSGEIRPMAIAMPSDGLHGEGSGYTTHPGCDAERWIVEEVPGCCREQYACLDNESPLFITGFSMGGFGALRLGAKHPEQFRAISAHASATHYDHLGRFWSLDRGDESYLSEEDKSALHWIRKHRNVLPPLRFDCGNEDILVEHNRELHRLLQQEEISHRYDEFPGRHSWDYCHDHLGDSLRFFEEVLRQT